MACWCFKLFNRFTADLYEKLVRMIRLEYGGEITGALWGRGGKGKKRKRECVREGGRDSGKVGEGMGEGREGRKRRCTYKCEREGGRER